MKVFVDRKGIIWWRDCYEVPEINDEILETVINDDINPKWSEPLIGTWEDIGELEVLDENLNKLKDSNKYD